MPLDKLLDFGFKTFNDLDEILKVKLRMVKDSFNQKFDLEDYVFLVPDEDFSVNFNEIDELTKVFFVVRKKINLTLKSDVKEKINLNFLLLDSMNVAFFADGVFDIKFFSLLHSDVNVFMDSGKTNLVLDVFVDDDVENNFNLSILSEQDTTVKVSTGLKDNSKLSFNLMSVNLGKLSVYGNGKVMQGSKANDIAMNLRCLHLGESVELTPVLEVNTNDVKASHSALSSGFNENTLFYFMAKGLSRKDAELLFAKETLGKYLKEKFFDEFIEKVSL